jgi:hypothetical protein
MGEKKEEYFLKSSKNDFRPNPKITNNNPQSSFLVKQDP